MSDYRIPDIRPIHWSRDLDWSNALKAGKKTLAWEKERAKLKVKFLGWGITTCELGYPGCWRDNALSFAHARKRRNLKPHELGEVILACICCHDKIEILDEEEMARVVRSVISSRIIVDR